MKEDETADEQEEVLLGPFRALQLIIGILWGKEKKFRKEGILCIEHASLRSAVLIQCQTGSQ